MAKLVVCNRCRDYISEGKWYEICVCDGRMLNSPVNADYFYLCSKCKSDYLKKWDEFIKEGLEDKKVNKDKKVDKIDT